MRLGEEKTRQPETQAHATRTHLEGRPPRSTADALGSHSINCTHQWWQVPAWRVLEVERITKIRRSELRPDLYPPARKAG
jgi:hypothetical protein